MWGKPSGTWRGLGGASRNFSRISIRPTTVFLGRSCGPAKKCGGKNAGSEIELIGKKLLAKKPLRVALRSRKSTHLGQLPATSDGQMAGSFFCVLKPSRGFWAFLVSSPVWPFCFGLLTSPPQVSGEGGNAGFCLICVSLKRLKMRQVITQSAARPFTVDLF